MLLAYLHPSGISETDLGVPPQTLLFIIVLQKLKKGFNLEFKVSTDVSNLAEIAVHLETSGHWFGGGHFIRQLWPISNAALEVGPWYAFDNGPNGLNNLLGPHWMTSRGLLVVVDPDTPFLHIGMNAPLGKGDQGWMPRKWGVGIQNAARELLPLSHDNDRVMKNGSDGLLRVQARNNYRGGRIDHPLRHFAQGPTESQEELAATSRWLSVKLALAATTNIADACMTALSTLSPPQRQPSAEVIKDPIWTTWARYKANVDQVKVMKYAHEIVDRNLGRSVMEIDDKWQTLYGDLSFDTKKFPDAVGMIRELHDMGFKVTTWVHPFVERRSDAYREGAARGYFVGKHRDVGKGVHSSVPAFFPWWNSPAACALDVTNPEAVEWFVQRLQHLQESTGIDGFKFDAGEPCFLPTNPLTHTPLATPADYTRLYVTNVAGRFAGGVSEVRTGHMTQDIAVLTRMGDRFSTWDQANGLRSLIPTLLTSGLLGYPFCLPDMIGGNSYFGAKPDAELMVRWAQVNALMPAMQFSIAPWDLSRDAETLVTSALAVRKKLEGVLLSLAEEAAHTLKPICRPLWMLDATDVHTYEIHDQFALGQDVIVAPVVHRGAKTRDVYLTQGVWRNINDSNRLIQGGQWLRQLHAPLDTIPVFIREGAQGVYF